MNGTSALGIVLVRRIFPFIIFSSFSFDEKEAKNQGPSPLRLRGIKRNDRWRTGRAASRFAKARARLIVGRGKVNKIVLGLYLI